MATSATDLRPAGFFLLRTPLLPYHHLFALGGDAVGAIERARSEPAVREAIYVASPDLYDASVRWERGELDVDAERKVVHAWYRYLARMSARSTPFGLFAGVSVGRIGADSSLQLAPSDAYRRRTTLDHSFVFLLSRALHRDPAFRAAATWYPNTSLYRADGRLRFAETLVDDPQGTMSHRLVSVDGDPVLDHVLDRARDGASRAELAERLVELTGAALEDAEATVDELVEHQLLVSDRAPAATGDPSLVDTELGLRRHPDPSLAHALAEVRTRVDRLDRCPPGADPEVHRDLAAALARLPVADLERSRLFQVDLWKPLADDTLGRDVAERVLDAVGHLARILPPAPPTPLDRMRTAFVERFGDQWVPLAIATDPELGLPYGPVRPELTGLLEGWPGEPEAPETEPFGERDRILLEWLRGAWTRGARELSLGAAELDRLADPEAPPLPDSFAAWFQLAEGQEVLLSAAVGPPATRLLGRFAHGSDRLTASLRELAEAEARLYPGAVVAEIAHLPEGRAGNVVARPVLRAHEIPYLARSGSPRDGQIPVDDLWLGVRGDRFVLRSARLGREVVPRLSTAQNTDHNTVPLYRFLADLQYQGVRSWVSWSWGALAGASHLPRVRLGSVVVARETWNLSQAELRPFADRSRAARLEHVRALRERYRVPRYVALADGDNELPVDLESPLAVEVLADLVRSRPRVRWVEQWPAPDQAGVRGPEGRFANEIVVPYLRVAASPAAAPLPPIEPSPWFGPGSEWLVAHLACGRSAIDPVLLEVVRPGLARAVDRGEVDRWSFDVTCSDAGWRITLNLHGTPQGLVAAVLPSLSQALAAAPGLVHGWSVGGRRAEPAPTERLSEADSAAALELLALVAGDEELRWKAAALSLDHLLRDLLPDPRARLAALERPRSPRAEVEEALSRIHRTRRAELTELLRDPGPASEICAARAARIEGALPELRRAGEPRSGLLRRVGARLLRGSADEHLLVVTDLLRRTYRSELARGAA